MLLITLIIICTAVTFETERLFVLVPTMTISVILYLMLFHLAITEGKDYGIYFIVALFNGVIASALNREEDEF